MKIFSRLLLMTALLSLPAHAEGFDFPVGDRESLDIASLARMGEHMDIIQGQMLMAHRGGNGGNSIASQFVTVAQNAANAWEAMCQERREAICDELPAFKAMLDNNSESFVTVLTDIVVKADDGEEREAVNLVRKDGTAYIVISETKWQDMDSDYYSKDFRKINLVLHEYFSLMGLESSDYYTESRNLYSLLEADDFSSAKIADKVGLPKACSVAVSSDGSVDQTRLRGVQSKLGQLGYASNQSKDTARFHLKVSQKCSGFFYNTCAIYAEMTDSFKVGQPIAHASHEVEQGLSKKETIQNAAFSDVFKSFPSCE